MWLPGCQLLKWSIHLTAASSNDDDAEVKKGREWSLQSLANDWQRWASRSHPQLWCRELLWQHICHDWKDNCIAFKKQIRGVLFRMPPAGLLISRDEKKIFRKNMKTVGLTFCRWGEAEWQLLCNPPGKRGKLLELSGKQQKAKLRADWVTDLRKDNSFHLQRTHALRNDGLRKLKLWACGEPSVYLEHFW